MIPYLSPDLINALTQREDISGDQDAQEHPEKKPDEAPRVRYGHSFILPHSKHARRSSLKHSWRWLAAHFNNAGNV
jgi:hypothetical protein